MSVSAEGEGFEIQLRARCNTPQRPRYKVTQDRHLYPGPSSKQYDCTVNPKDDLTLKLGRAAFSPEIAS